MILILKILKRDINFGWHNAKLVIVVVSGWNNNT